MRELLDFAAVHRVVRALRLEPAAVVHTLSPGQRFKLRLCATVLRPGVALLLLDEPTTHLDLATVLVVEELVRRCSVACLIVSHDARFLRATVSTVLELDAATRSLRSTTASFDDYLRDRDRRRRAAAAAEEARAQRVAALDAHAKALSAAAAQGARHDTGDRDKLLRDFKRDRAGRSSKAAGVRVREKQRALAEEGDTDVPGDLLAFGLEALHEREWAAAGETASGVQLDEAHLLSLEDARFGYGDAVEFGPMSLGHFGGRVRRAARRQWLGQELDAGSAVRRTRAAQRPAATRAASAHWRAAPESRVWA